MTPEVRAARAGMLTASMAGVIMGGLTTDGLKRYVNQLAFERLYGLPDDEGYQSKAMTQGIEREASALEWYAFDQDCELIQGDEFLVYPSLPYVGATPDARRCDRTVQVKCPSAHVWAEIAKRREIPAEYRWQCRWEQWVAQVWLCDFVAWHPLANGIVIASALTVDEAEQMAERAAIVNTMVIAAMYQIRSGNGT